MCVISIYSLSYLHVYVNISEYEYPIAKIVLLYDENKMSTSDTIKGGLISYIFGIVVEILYNIIFFTKFGSIGLFVIFILWLIYFDKHNRGLVERENLFFNLGISLIQMAKYARSEIKSGNEDFAIGIGIGGFLYLLATYSGYFVSILVISAVGISFYYMQLGIEKLDAWLGVKRN